MKQYMPIHCEYCICCSVAGMLQSSGALLLLLLSDTPCSAGVAAGPSPLMPLLLVFPSTGITPSTSTKIKRQRNHFYDK
jgi:hypothetical protein